MIPMTDQLWILVIMAGVIVLLALIALVLFTPPRPAVPREGPIQIAVAPFKDLEPDQAQVHAGDALAHDFAKSLNRYARIEADVSDTDARFVMNGEVRRQGPRVAINLKVTSDRRTYWRRSVAAKDADLPAATAKAVDALARQMKLALR